MAENKVIEYIKTHWWTWAAMAFVGIVILAVIYWQITKKTSNVEVRSSTSGLQS